MAVFNILEEAAGRVESNPFRNVIDPFNAVFESMSINKTLSEWLNSNERARQIKKSLENAIGDFHENILGSIEGWEKLDRAGVDLVNKEMKVVAEVKNKFNTMKGNTKQEIYDVLKTNIDNNYASFVGYAVEIVPSSKKPYNRLYTPSHNGLRRPKNNNIRQIDGYSFYSLATGESKALAELYRVLPQVIGDLLDRDFNKIYSDSLFTELFSRAYFKANL
jgi:hypothetical protein